MMSISRARETSQSSNAVCARRNDAASGGQTADLCRPWISLRSLFWLTLAWLTPLVGWAWIGEAVGKCGIASNELLS